MTVAWVLRMLPGLIAIAILWWASRKLTEVQTAAKRVAEIADDARRDHEAADAKFELATRMFVLADTLSKLDRSDKEALAEVVVEYHAICDEWFLHNVSSGLSDFDPRRDPPPV